MSAVIPFVRPAARSDNWSQQELAEFYRVEAALIRAGIGIASEHGISDEGEPWFVFCRPDGDAIMHFARIDGSYLIASEVLDHPVRGADFRALIDQIATLYPHLLPLPAVATGTKLVIHPAALLAALVAAAALILSSEDAQAGEIGAGLDPIPASPSSEGGGAVHDQPQAARLKAVSGPGEQGTGRKQVEAIILSTMIFAAEAMAGDHADASSDPGHLLSHLVGGAAHQRVQGEAALGTSGAADAGPASAALVQPAVLTAQGSGASQDAVSMGGRTDPVPAIRIDLSGERAGPPGREAPHHAPGAGNDTGLTRVAAESSSVQTSGQQTSATGRAEAAAGPSAGSGADVGESRSTISQAPTPEASSPSRLADTALAESGTGPGSQAWIHAAAQTEASRAAVASAPRDADVGGDERHHGSRAEAETVETGKAVRAEDGHGRGSGQDVKAPSSGPNETGPGSPGGGAADRGPPGQKAALTSGGDAPAASPGKVGHGSGPAGQGEHPGQPARDGHPAEAGSEPGTAAGKAEKESGSGSDAPASHGIAASAASHRGSEKAAAHQGAGQGGPADEQPASSASPASGSAPHRDPDSAKAHAAPKADHAEVKDTARHPTEASASHDPGSDAADHGSPAQRGGGPGGGQDHPGHTTPASAAAQAGPSGHEVSHADRTHPDRDVPSQAGSHDANAHPPAGGPASSHGGANAPAETGSAPAGTTGPAAARVDHGSPEASFEDTSGAGGHHAAHGNQPVPAATLPHGQVAPVQINQNHPSSPTEPSTGPTPMPRAAIDQSGNLVFHGDAHPSALPPPSHGAEDSAAHPGIGLVGVPDHGHSVHDLYHHG